MSDEQGRHESTRLVVAYAYTSEAPGNDPAHAVTRMLDLCRTSASDEGFAVSEQAVDLLNNAASDTVLVRYVRDLLRRSPTCVIIIGRHEGIVGSTVIRACPDKESDGPESATLEILATCHSFAQDCDLAVVEQVLDEPVAVAGDEIATQVSDVLMRELNCVIVICPTRGITPSMAWSIRFFSRRHARASYADCEILCGSVLDARPSGPFRPAGAPPQSPSVPPRVPSLVRQDPLPHDGLFIRRNNAFGTRSTLGIADLIEQGVLIDQTQIRFDDFIVSRTDQVPQPPVGEAVAVSHGSTAIRGGAKAHETTTHFLEIALRAGSAPASGVPQGEILPVNFVFVVDTSSSMSGEKLDMVKTSIRELYTQLRGVDVLGIVAFNHGVRTVLSATRKSELSSERFTEVVAGLIADGGTDLNLGVLYGIDEISRHAHGRSDIVNCLYLFSDGDPTSGETNWITIRTNIGARIRGDLTLSCFGFGSDARVRELEALAGLTGGHSTFVVDPEDVRLNLVEDLSRREHLAAINVQLQIEIDPAIRIWHLYGHDQITDPVARDAVMRDAQAAQHLARDKYGAESSPDLITQDKGIRIFAPDLAFGETYWIVFELEVPSGKTVADLGRATVQYVDTVARASRRHELTLTQTGAIPTETVAVHAIGLWTSEITFYALDDLYENDRETATRRLSKHVQVLQGIHAVLPDTQIRDDQVICRKLISLVSNLGQSVYLSDRGNEFKYARYTMNEFGRVRGGFARNRHMTL